jgi:hypothetical protein
VSEFDRDASIMKRPGALGVVAPWEKYEKNFIIIYLMYSGKDFIVREIYLLMKRI